jgi:prevent-host-death family protein
MINRTSTQFAATASAAEVARNFGRYKELAQRGAVAVTSHGRDSLVLLSADEYARLKALDDDMVDTLALAVAPEALSAFDHEPGQTQS